ncbi:MAG: tRNA (adenosine(37)-N6)-dimethylallyltransferase MiaA [Armatimonadota bacterium]
MHRNRSNDKRLVAIVGPTASGKTAAAHELARRVGAEIVSADSMAIYRGMDIGTAKPSPQERQEVPYYMVDVVGPNEPFTVADYQERAVEAVEDIISRGRLPILAGGTGLYVRAVIDGLNIPSAGIDSALRARLKREADEKGGEWLHKQLAEVDPAAAGRLHPNDIKRIIRALEVYEQSGRPMSEIVEETRLKAPRYPGAVLYGLTMDREKLYRRIEERIDEQIRRGLVEEVRQLLDFGYDVDLPAMQGLGYKEIAAHLKGECDLSFAVETLKRSTRRFAKRQYTWFRADKRIRWIDVNDIAPAEVAVIIETELREAGVFE